MIGLRKWTGMLLGILAEVGLAVLDGVFGVPNAQTIAICIASIAGGHQVAQAVVDRR